MGRPRRTWSAGSFATYTPKETSACTPPCRSPLAAAAESAGWAEPHYLVETGQAPATVVMLYAPRDLAEQAVVLRLVRASYEFALAQGRGA